MVSDTEMKWRCAECGHGRHLTAYAQAVSFGPLNAAGDLERHDSVDDCFVFTDSIQCEKHIDAAIEAKVDGRWCRWVSCSHCRGRGERRTFYEARRCQECKGEGGEYVRLVELGAVA